MKHLYSFILVFAISFIAASAQSLLDQRAYKYELIQNLDKNGNIVGEQRVSGVIGIGSDGRDEAISVTIGEEIMYLGVVHSKKTANDNGEKVITYLVIMEFQGYRVPLQIFERYNLTKSSVIPSSFAVFVCNKDTGEIVQGQSFHYISRVL